MNDCEHCHGMGITLKGHLTKCQHCSHSCDPSGSRSEGVELSIAKRSLEMSNAQVVKLYCEITEMKQMNLWRRIKWALTHRKENK